MLPFMGPPVCITYIIRECLCVMCERNRAQPVRGSVQSDRWRCALWRILQSNKMGMSVHCCSVTG